MKPFAGKVGFTAVALLLAIVKSSAADPVVLTSKAGGFEIAGDLVGLADGLMTVRSSMGVVKVPVAEVTCAGVGCPREPETATVATQPARGPARATPMDVGTLSIGAGVPEDLVRDLLDAFAAESGATVETAGTGATSIAVASGSLLILWGNSVPGAARLELRAPVAGDTPLALDPVVVVSGPVARPASMSLQDLADVFTGRSKSWSDLGGRPIAVVPVLPAGETAVQSVLAELIGDNRLADGLKQVDDPIDFLTASPGAIALVRNSKRGPLPAVSISGECGLLTSASDFAVQIGQYPLAAALVFTSDRSDPGLDAFLNFLESPKGQAIITRHGMVGREIRRADPAWLADWIATATKLAEFESGRPEMRQGLRELVEASATATRLSPTFRYPFDRGSSGDGMLPDFTRLAAAIEAGERGDHSVIFAGFVDGRGRETDAQRQSVTVAERVLADFLTAHPDLRERGDIAFEAVGYGSVAPLACSSIEVERRANDRVEVWLRRP